MNENLLQNARFIPNNVLRKGKILNIDWIRWAEAILFTGLMGVSVWSSELTVKVRLIVLIVSGTSIFAFFLHGIKNRSVMQVIVDLLKDKSCHIRCSLAVPNKKDRKRELNEFGKQSMFQRVIKAFICYAEALDKKYGA